MSVEAALEAASTDGDSFDGLPLRARLLAIQQLRRGISGRRQVLGVEDHQFLAPRFIEQVYQAQCGSAEG